MPISLLPEGDFKLLTRRGFISRTAAAALVGLEAQRTALTHDQKPPWLAWLSDTHIDADPGRMNLSQNMSRNLERVVTEILAEPTKPDAVFIDGDLALKNGQAGDYERLLALLKPIREAKIPLHLALGNHDDRDQFRRVLSAEPPGASEIQDKHVLVIDLAGLRLIVLDSLDKPDLVPGVLGASQLSWLARALDTEPARPTILFVHHNLSEKQGALTETRQLLEIAEPRKAVKAIVYGHSHRWERTQQEGIHWLNLPAVGYPFSADQPLGWCRFEPGTRGATLTLRAIGGATAADGQRVELEWRA
jgi:3',5'-cyclic AMP phosphodiesterase CpdA